MNKYTIGTLSALGIVSIAAVSSLTFAASGTTSNSTKNTGNGKNIEHRMAARENILSNIEVVAALKAAGITTPTEAEIQANMEKMKAMKTGIDNLSTTDQTALKALRDANRTAEDALRDANQAKEREFLRSKGVSVPTEAELAKEKKIQDIIRTTLGDKGRVEG